MSFFIVDIEADAPSPMTGSMVCFGAVKVDDKLDKTFYGKTKPINTYYNPDSLSISGFSREEHLGFDNPKKVMNDFNNWIKKVNRNGRPIFFSDNLAYDWMWICCYFDLALINNPFGYSGRRIGDLYSGLTGDPYKKWKHLRDTNHTHHPVDDAIGNAEALIKICNMGIKFKFK